MRADTRAYEPDERGGFRLRPVQVTAPGASSIYSTVDDMAKWVLNFSSARVGGPAVLQQMHRRGELTTGERIGYAFGQSLGKYRGLPYAGHGGRWGGFRSALIRFPDDDFAVIVLSNVSNIDAERMGFRIADVYLGHRMERAFRPLNWIRAALAGAATRARTVLADRPSESALGQLEPIEDLAQYSGEYYSEELDTTYNLIVEDGRLVAQHSRNAPVQLSAVTPDVYSGSEPFFRRLKFERDPARHVTAFLLTTERGS